MRNKFLGLFHAVTKIGTGYVNDQRFKALVRDGKPLWEFKEHDHRIFCRRAEEGRFVRILLLHGWIKDKNGRTAHEQREVQHALMLLHEFEANEMKRSR